jgi:hypothetical protein
VHVGMPYCAVCNARMKEYTGFNIKAGEGDWYCPRCVEGGGVPIAVENDITPVCGISIYPVDDWDWDDDDD